MVYYMALRPNLFALNLPDLMNKKSVTQNMAISVETVPIAKYGPSKNQSEHSDLPQVYLAK